MFFNAIQIKSFGGRQERFKESSVEEIFFAKNVVNSLIDQRSEISQFLLNLKDIKTWIKY